MADNSFKNVYMIGMWLYHYVVYLSPLNALRLLVCIIG